LEDAVYVEADSAGSVLGRLYVNVGSIGVDCGGENLVEDQSRLRVTFADGCRRIEMPQRLANVAYRKKDGSDVFPRLLP
jgi:hypothetical protein